MELVGFFPEYLGGTSAKGLHRDCLSQWSCFLRPFSGSSFASTQENIVASGRCFLGSVVIVHRWGEIDGGGISFLRVLCYVFWGLGYFQGEGFERSEKYFLEISKLKSEIL